jgi:hypothetical protein
LALDAPQSASDNPYWLNAQLRRDARAAFRRGDTVWLEECYRIDANITAEVVVSEQRRVRRFFQAKLTRFIAAQCRAKFDEVSGEFDPRTRQVDAHSPEVEAFYQRVERERNR